MKCKECNNEITEEQRITIEGMEDLCYSCYKKRPKRICIDFDGVIAQYSGWKGPNHFGEPFPETKDFLDQLHNEGYEIHIHTTRRPPDVIAWIQKYGFAKNYFIHVTNTKIPAVAYIDDRAILFVATSLIL